MKYELSNLALKDIDSIWEHTMLNWSIRQAEKYYLDIFSEIEFVCKNPEIGISIDEIKPTHRNKLVGSHLIIYKVLNDIIFIDRILHQRMDIEDQLKDLCL